MVTTRSAPLDSKNGEISLDLRKPAGQKHPCFNYQSRRGIERLGAKMDGVLRSHQIADNGTLRDTCVYSIIASEWPTVKAHLTWQMERPRPELG